MINYSTIYRLATIENDLTAYHGPGTEQMGGSKSLPIIKLDRRGSTRHA